jgi:preprotein translocase subunit SecE
VAEWSIAAVLKTALGESSTGVRIPPSPPVFAWSESGERKLSRQKREARRRTDQANGRWPDEEKKFVNSWIHIAIWAVLIGAAFTYLWWQGQITSFANYIRETREELKKCSWPSWVELRGSTTLIAVVIVILGAFVVIVDFGLNEFFFNFLYKL